MTFRYSWSLFSWGREHCCPHSGLGGVVGDTQEGTKKEARTQAGFLMHTGKPMGMAVSHCITRFHQLILTACQIC